MKVANRTFIISGGSSGLGLGTAQNLLDAGAFIANLDLNHNNELESKYPDRIKFFKVDITKDDQIDKAVESTAEWATKTGAVLGGVINCAGTGAPSKIIDARGNLHSKDLWNFVIAVNLTGAFFLTRAAVKHLVNVAPEGPDGERGVVIFVSSSAAFEGQPGQDAYSASKGALNSLTLPLSRDLERNGIRVNTLAPSAFASAMTDRMPEKTRASLTRELGYPKRFGQAHEFAQTVRFLIECTYMNGEVLRLSGGARLPGRL